MTGTMYNIYKKYPESYWWFKRNEHMHIKLTRLAKI